MNRRHACCAIRNRSSEHDGWDGRNGSGPTHLMWIRRGALTIILGFACLQVNSLAGLAQAETRPVKEFTMRVYEQSLTLLSEPTKQATVWAFALDGQEPSVPGPVLRVQKGDRVRVHFHNSHTLPHTIHFHGVHPFEMDGNGQRALGTEQVQLPGESYTYEFVAETPGYYLYHCHFDTPTHVDHGMYGLLIVEDPQWPAVDREFVIFWDEWDTDGDGAIDTHTINSRSAPEYEALAAGVGDTVRLILVNVGQEVHTPHLHGHGWHVRDPGNLQRIHYGDPNGVISVAPGEVKIVETLVDREGTWLFHCHVFPHVMDDGVYPRGMLTAMIVGRQQDDRKASQEKAASALAEPAHERPTKMSGNIRRGEDLFALRCETCHGKNAKGGYGPKLSENPILENYERFQNTVLEGRAGRMPPWRGILSPQAIADIHAWLKTLKTK